MCIQRLTLWLMGGGANIAMGRGLIWSFTVCKFQSTLMVILSGSQGWTELLCH